MKVMDELRDTTITCVACRRGFTWTAGERRFYQSKGLSQPKRCPKCREYRRATLVQDPEAARQ